MAKTLVECIANYSEARRSEVVEAILQSITTIPGVRVLDLHSDPDHNRSVITFIGSPEAVEEAAFQSIQKAAELINLDQHTGEHPRIGATDVVPFVPISGVTMEECVALARHLGQRVGTQLKIPVYLYEQAATRPERQNLENIRRGQYESLKKEISTLPDRAPDFGPHSLGPAGATVIGARHPLVAYNVYLTTDDITIANKIAKAIRNSSGGLRYVKALGMLVEGRAQVSMNLTNFHSTPIARVVEMIRREAARYGVGVDHSELVGLIPQAALIDAAVWYLQLDQFQPDQILESKLYLTQEETSLADTIQASRLDFLDELAAGTATPGGGAASAYSAAAAAALVAMVARLTTGKKKYISVEAQMQNILKEAERIRFELATAVHRDSAAFEKVMAAFKLPKETSQEELERLKAIEQATWEATLVPLEVCHWAVEILSLASQVISLGNLNAISDGGSAAALARAALTGASLNVRINVKSLPPTDRVQNALDELIAIEKHANELEALIHKVLNERGGLIQA
jgi:glutamate formiminotransferase/formiminotetrahydrofolate cyclodeaminase